MATASAKHARLTDAKGHESPIAAALSMDTEALHAHLLQHVSRTFALTIPELPRDLRWVVGNAYLLCRTVDTIEDEPNLDADEKTSLCAEFIDIVAGNGSVEAYSKRLSGLLTSSTPPAEHQLIDLMPRVIATTRTFRDTQRRAIERCLRIMANGMATFQRRPDLNGLEDLRTLDEYCYVVAGVVGEMLTELFCDHSRDVAQFREQLLRLSVRFGQGLQMTNILKDIWEDQARGACWLPRAMFSEVGIDLNEITVTRNRPEFRRVLGQLIGIAHNHLRAALRYTLLIPTDQRGIRLFCLWALGMAVLTLRKLDRQRDFTSGAEVKISRRSVKTTAALCRLGAQSNRSLSLMFEFASMGLPEEQQPEFDTTTRAQ